MSDPFGNGFCFIEFLGLGYAGVEEREENGKEAKD